MGGSASVSKAHVFPDGITLTNEEVNEVKASWEILKESDVDSTRVGAIMFKNLFVKAPETFSLFGTFKDIEDWENSKQYHHHCKVVIKIIGHVVKVLVNPDLLDQNLHYMGMRHSLFTILPRHFDILGEEMIVALEEVLGDRLTPLAKSTWATVYTILSLAIQKIMKEFNDECAYDPTTEEESKSASAASNVPISEAPVSDSVVVQA